ILDQGNIEQHLESIVKEQKLERAGIRKTTLDSLQSNIHITAGKISGDEIKENNTAVNAGAGFAGAFMIYIFIFLYGVQVMKGVAEEKSNRIVEVIISSVKPFQLMMGKILGIALVGLTQILIWILLSLVLITVVTAVIGSGTMDTQTANEMLEQSAKMPQTSAGAGMLHALFQLNF